MIPRISLSHFWDKKMPKFIPKWHKDLYGSSPPLREIRIIQTRVVKKTNYRQWNIRLPINSIAAS